MSFCLFVIQQEINIVKQRANARNMSFIPLNLQFIAMYKWVIFIQTVSIKAYNHGRNFENDVVCII